jgi:hypothetical protein
VLNCAMEWRIHPKEQSRITILIFLILVYF